MQGSPPPSAARPRWWSGPSSRLPRSARRPLLLLAAVPLALYLAYLLAGNVLLNTGLGERIANRKPDAFEIHWRGGHTLWPGRVTVRDVRLRGHVARTRWWVEAGRVDGRLAIAPLFARTVHVPRLDARGLRGGVSRAGTERPRAPARPGGWTLRFDRIVAEDVREGRLMDLQLRGRGRAEVGFTKQLRGGAMELLPSHVRFESARLSRGGADWLSAATIDARFALARHTRVQAAGIDKLRLLDASVAIAGRTPSPHVVVDDDGRVAASQVPGGGRLDGSLAFARGALVPGGALRLVLPVSGRGTHGQALTQPLRVRLEAGSDLRIHANYSAAAGDALSLDADVTVRGTTLPLRDVASLLPRTSGHVVGRWHFGSLAWLTGLFGGAEWLAIDGAGRVDADLRVVDGRLADGSRVRVPEVGAVASVMGNLIRGSASADMRLDVAADGTLRPELDLEMQEFVIADMQSPDRPFVEGRDLTLEVRAVDGLSRDALLGGNGLQMAAAAMRARLAFRDARVRDLRAYNRYLPRSQLRFDGGSGRMSGDLTLDGHGAIAHGTLRAEARGARMHAGGLDVSGDVRIDGRLRRASLRSHALTIDGSRVRVDRASFREPGGERRSGWWAQVDFERARMDWDRPSRIDSRARIQMKDVGFLLSLFSRQRDYPKWVYRLVDDGQARASGTVRWSGNTLLLDDVVARNDRYEINARLRLRDSTRRGQLLAQWRKLQVGVERDGERRKFHVVRARQWYASQAGSLR